MTNFTPTTTPTPTPTIPALNLMIIALSHSTLLLSLEADGLEITPDSQTDYLFELKRVILSDKAGFMIASELSFLSFHGTVEIQFGPEQMEILVQFIGDTSDLPIVGSASINYNPSDLPIIGSALLDVGYEFYRPMVDHAEKEFRKSQSKFKPLKTHTKGFVLEFLQEVVDENQSLSVHYSSEPIQEGVSSNVIERNRYSSIELSLSKQKHLRLMHKIFKPFEDDIAEFTEMFI